MSRTDGVPTDNVVPMSFRRRLAWSVLPLLLLALNSCGDSSPVAKSDGFKKDVNDTRTFDRYGQTEQRLSHVVSYPIGTQHVRVRTDCIGKGEIRVSVFGGAIGSPCGDKSSPGGYIGMSKSRPLRKVGSTRVRVRAPEGSQWSVAVDFGPGELDIALPHQGVSYSTPVEPGS